MSAPEMRVSLTPFDHCVPRAYYNGALYLPLKAGVTPARTFDLLHEGLHRVFVRLPWLNGQVHFQSPDTPGWRPGQLELRYKPVFDGDGPRPPQLKFKELETDLDYAALRELGFPLDGFRDADIAPTGFFADPSTGPDVFVGQVNFLSGGCIIVSAIHHSASDETAFFHVLRLWADHCAALQTGCAAAPVVDFPAGSDSRDTLRQIWARETPVSSVGDIDPETWRLVGLLPTDVQQKGPGHLPDAPSAPPQPPTIKPPGSASGRVLKAGVFYISPAQLTALREAIGVASSGMGISANDAVCALIWRCFLRVRVAVRLEQQQQAKESSGLNMVCDGRANYSSALPQTYLGNITFNVQSSLPLSTLIAAAEEESALGAVAATLRRNSGRIDSANLLNLYNLLHHLPSYDELIRLKRMRTSTIDGNDMSISSLINVPMDSVCFGDGPVFGNKGFVESARLLMEANNSFTRTCIVLPRIKNGGVEFLANLYDEEMDLLMADAEFTRYVLCLCWPE
ncbi:hypothetical protein QBC46DRAFT_440729 [Diplogelasinospora grovesii]|uniref:Trichothecene 3-O-acetyltransferase-like N-terminal domain-containing protein n=1 Tax=Diplogelasinospora grovesii TaxID=303347 RepID=A0AAN6S8Y9_9PEZI|nr:hypothetical protein QBC46DRAFT_440729 [Diplogelasinospora grovesii]